MRRTFLGLIAFILLSHHLVCASAQKIGPDLYAYISTNDASANSTFLVGDTGILVVDTGLNALEGRKLLQEIRKVSSLPVRWIVNTHYHPDHRGGNSVVGPEAVIITTRFTRDQALKAFAEQARTEGQQPINDVSQTLGAQGLTLYIGSHEVEIYHPGPAHTRGDLIVYFPGEHAVATGDLFLNGSCPAMDDGDLENWITALDRILVMPVDHVVPGHFALATKAEMRHFRDYLAGLRDQVAGMSAHGRALEQIKEDLDMSMYKDLRQYPQYEATFAGNAAAYYGQLQRKKHQ